MNTIHRESIEKQLSEMYKTKTDPIELKEAADQSVRENRRIRRNTIRK